MDKPLAPFLGNVVISGKIENFRRFSGKPDCRVKVRVDFRACLCRGCSLVSPQFKSKWNKHGVRQIIIAPIMQTVRTYIASCARLFSRRSTSFYNLLLI